MTRQLDLVGQVTTYCVVEERKGSSGRKWGGMTGMRCDSPESMRVTGEVETTGHKQPVCEQDRLRLVSGLRMYREENELYEAKMGG